jgi:hypothetical protein
MSVGLESFQRKEFKFREPSQSLSLKLHPRADLGFSFGT